MRRSLAVACAVCAVCACLALGTAQAGNLADARVAGLSFASITAQDAFARIGAQAGVVIAIHDDVHALITAKEVSGRLPVVLDKLTGSLGLTWEEKDGVVVVRRAEKKPVAVVGVTPAAPVVSVPATPTVVAQAKQSETAPVLPQPAAALPSKPVEPPVAAATPAGKSAAAAPKAEEPAKEAEPPRPAFILKLAGSDLPAYALRDFLRSHGMALVWGAGDVGSVAPVAREYTGDTPLAVADAVLRAHGLHGIYARSDKTLYVR